MLGISILTLTVGLFHLQACTAELKLVQVLFRHGNRAPDFSNPVYPNDPHINNTYEPDGIAGLVNAGKLGGYKFGQYLCKRYGSFLGPIYSPSIVRFYADEFDRIMMSAEVAAAGMFPPTELQQWHPTLKWQPIPVWTRPLEEDILYYGWYCSHHVEVRDRLERTDPYLCKRREVYQEFFDYLSQHAGSNITQKQAFWLYHILHFQYDLGLKLPSWTKRVYPNGPLKEVATCDLIIQSYNRELQKLTGGMWLREWLKHVDEYLNSTAPLKRKAHIYAGHLINIAAILISLKNFDNRIPDFTSSVMFELHKIEDEAYVKVLHRDPVLRELTIPGCGGPLCPLKTFRRIVKPIITDDPKKLCGVMRDKIF